MLIGLNLLFLKPGKVGGTQTYAQSLIKAFAIAGKEHKFILFLNLECRNLFAGLPENFVTVFCNIPGNIRPLRVLYEQTMLPMLLCRYKVDILHSLGQTTPLMSPCPSVITVHDMNYWTCANFFPLHEKFAAQMFVKQALFSTDHIIAVSSFTQNELMKWLGVRHTKITVVHEGSSADVTENASRYTMEDLAILLQCNVSQPFLLTVASPWPHKNVAGLIAAYRELLRLGPAPKLVIVGHSVERMPKVADELSKLDKHANVIFTGYVDCKHLPAFYRNAQVFLFPSLYEGFGLPILEAMSYGLPVVSSNRASLPEVAGDAAILADPTDPAAFASQIHRVLDDVELRNNLSKRGRERAAEFTWEQTALKTIAVYEEVLRYSRIPGTSKSH